MLMPSREWEVLLQAGREAGGHGNLAPEDHLEQYWLELMD